ncbi:hypothetical protein [Halomarina rubra]|uniref:Uncharacterized protein n=1 Tax=Halomarina rubra TaxID=2071873 RepID=A0ABD6AP96_9EURY|nr:hypothetical protein [Halomarina rubra]
MTPHDDAHDRVPTCEAVTFVPADSPDPRRGSAVDDERYVRCGTEAVGKYRMTPESGGVVANWLCRQHRDHLAEIITETVETR